ncbi:MAG: transposase family protein [Proteobacteria bacterium]|uniref:Transposase family protein n=1 Tax=Candidatus Avisuccinivibrio stercorigallinarum TaxID=2840704 RepID=A0A9D9DDI4_9GAMM|nr:transposase family protein [Candidatus Avisuccinivibrio stercorigallinarum]
MAIDIQTTRRTLIALAKNPEQSVRALAEKVGIGKDKVYELKDKLEKSKLTEEQIASMPDEELSKRFNSKQDRKPWVYMDFIEVFHFSNKNKEHKPGSNAAILDAWRKLYLQGIFGFTQDVNPAFPGQLPDGCMPFATFLRKYREWEKLHGVKPVKAASAETGPIASDITEVLPGSQMQIDASGDPVYWKTPSGRIIKSVLFVAVLAFSGLVFAWLGPDHSVRTWCRFIIAAVKHFGGRVDSIKSDNEAALTWRRKITAVDGTRLWSITVNPTVLYINRRLGMESFLCDSYSATEKALNERAVGSMQRFKGVVLGHSMDDLPVAVSYDAVNEMLQLDVAEFNSRPVKDRKSSRQAFFEAFERQHLKPVTVGEIRIPDKVDDKHSVSASGYIRVKGNNYYVGEKYAACSVLVLFFPDNKIEILQPSDYTKLKEYDLDTRPYPRVRNIKHPEDYTSSERFVSRSLDDLLEDCRRRMPDIADEVEQVLRKFFNHSRLPDAGKKQTGNRLLKLCGKFYNSAPTQLKQGLDCILHAGRFDNVTIISVLEDFISVSTVTAPRTSTAKEIQIIKNNSEFGLNAMDKEDNR